MTITQSILGAGGWLALTFATAWLGSRFRPDEWYQQLAKPTWNPPNRIFAPVWTLLYVLMAIAAWSVWNHAGFAAASVPLTLFVIQLLLNTAWTWTFFGLRRPGTALVDIIILWLVILMTLITFWGVEPLAGVLLLPYLTWVTFATALNWTIWRMNRDNEHGHPSLANEG